MSPFIVGVSSRKDFINNNSGYKIFQDLLHFLSCSKTASHILPQNQTLLPQSTLKRMEIPYSMRKDLHVFLLNKTDGVFLDTLCKEYQDIVQKPLNIIRYGFQNIEALIRFLPDVARLEYCAKDKRMKVFGVKDSISVLQTPIQTELASSLKHERPFQAQATGPIADANNCHGIYPEKHFDLKPDKRGFYSVCFHASNRPATLGTLKDVFGLAGNVLEVNETSRWFFISFRDARSAYRALRMFAHLDLRPANSQYTYEESGFGENQRPDTASHKQSNFSEPPKMVAVPRKRKRKFVNKDGPCYRVYVGNLDPNVKYTFDMFRDLFKKYRIGWTKLKAVVAEGKKMAFCYLLVANREEAKQLVEEYNGCVWFGREIKLELKEKKASMMKVNAENQSESAASSSVPDWESIDDYKDIPGFEPGLESVMPGLEPAVPGLEPTMPGLEPARPGLEPAMPGLEPVMPGLELARPGLEPVMPPGLEPTRPGLEPVMPGLELARPGLEPVMPRLGPARPGFKSALPGLDPTRPGLQPTMLRLKHSLPALEQIPVREDNQTWHNDHHLSEVTPTILVTNFRDDIKKEDFLQRFSAYRPQSIYFVKTENGKREAYIRLKSNEDVKYAVQNLNQTFFKGFTLGVKVPSSVPEYTTQSTGDVVIKLSEILKIRGHCLQILQMSDANFHLGHQIEVIVTSVVSESFFWGQLVNLHSLEQLKVINSRINESRRNIEAASGPGPCLAIFQDDGKWYRAWVMRTRQQSELARVFFLDYGNTAAVPWNHTEKIAEQWLWKLQPMAIPFALIEPVTNLKSRELSHMVVEVNAFSSQEEGNMVVVRGVSLIPDVKKSVSTVGEIVVM